MAPARYSHAMADARRERRTPKPVTEDRLKAAALAYLERFATSSANLRRVLMRRVDRSARLHGTDPDAGARMVEALIARYLAAGMLDDRVYAEAKVASLHRRGASAKAIAFKLATKGIGRDLAEAVMEVDMRGDETRPGGDLAAAAALARRRRLGPYRPEAARETYRQKDLAAFARGGFLRNVAERVLACADPDALAALLAEDG